MGSCCSKNSEYCDEEKATQRAKEIVNRSIIVSSSIPENNKSDLEVADHLRFQNVENPSSDNLNHEDLDQLLLSDDKEELEKLFNSNDDIQVDQLLNSDSSDQ